MKRQTKTNITPRIMFLNQNHLDFTDDEQNFKKKTIVL